MPTRYLLTLSFALLFLTASCSKSEPKISTPDTPDITGTVTEDGLLGDWVYEVSTLENLSPEELANAPKDFTSIVQVKLSFRKKNSAWVTIAHRMTLQGKTYSRRSIYQGKYQLQGDRLMLTDMEVLQRMEAIPELGLDADDVHIEFAQGAVLRWQKNPEQLIFFSEDNPATSSGSSEGMDVQTHQPIFTRQK